VGCRTTYHWDRADPQIVGGICHKQSVNRQYEHLWKWDTAAYVVIYRRRRPLGWR
jgi:hypothetical protein